MPKPRPKKTLYYAHAMCLYGHYHEDAELELIRAGFPGHRIVNPAGYDDHPAKRRDTLGFCFRLIDKADVVVFSRLLGKVTAGVGAEVRYALEAGKPVFEIRDGRLVAVKRPVRFIGRDATVALYREFRAL